MVVQFINSLQFKLAVGFLLVALMPLGIVGVFAVRTANQIIQTIVTNQLENVAAEKQQLLQRWLSERKADMEVVAGSAAVRSLDPKAIADHLKLVQREYLVYRQFVVAGSDGKVVFSTAADGPAGLGDHAWFQQAMAGRRYMSAVRLDDDGQESVFQLASPIPGPDGKPQGGLCATVSTAGIRQDVLKASLGETGECYLVDKTGRFLAHNDPHRILRDNIAESESFANIFREEDRRPVYTDYRKIAVLGASRPIPDTEWYVVVEQDEAEAFVPSYKLRWNVCIALVVTAAGAVAISLALAYYVSAPIRTLNQAAHALAQGEFDSPSIHPGNRRRDEIGMLRVAFEDMAEQLRARHNTLEARVGSTQAELQQTDIRLQHTIKAAARSEHLAALGRLASGVAHEIRTPLASLKLYLQSVQEEISISPEFSEDFRIAMRQVERIEGTVNHFLNFARPQEPVLTEVNFRKLLDDAVMVVRPRANHQGIGLETSVAAPLPVVLGDVRQLGEAIVNLMVNALEEMSAGGSLNVAIRADSPDGAAAGPCWVRIDVADSGPGIKEEDLDKLFEPFFTTKASGSGLGLTIVRGTVQRHGGIVRVSASPGRGTTFSIFLPADTAAGPSKA